MSLQEGTVTSLTRGESTHRSTPSRLLLPYKGPAPYSSYRQRPTGFAMAKPISSNSQELTPDEQSLNAEVSVPVPASSHGPLYPPAAGSTAPPLDIPLESPPSYESVCREIQRRSLGVAASETLASIPGSALPYPPEPSPPPCDSIGFILPKHTVGADASELSRRPSAPSDTIPFSNTALYPPENPPPVSSFRPMPQPRSALYPPENPYTSTTLPSMLVSRQPPYPSANALESWDMIRSAVPNIVASHRLPPQPPAPYPTENITPSRGLAPYPPAPYPTEYIEGTHPVVPYPPETIPGDRFTSFGYPSGKMMPMPTPDTGYNPAGAELIRNPYSVSSVPYPQDSYPPKCDAIGFDAFEKAVSSGDRSISQNTVSTEARDTNLRRSSTEETEETDGQ